MKLYRYRPLNAQTIESLCNDQLYFSSPSDFNDPLDCRPYVEPDSDVSTLRDILFALVAHRVEREVFAAFKDARVFGQDEAVGAHAKNMSQQAARYAIDEVEYFAMLPSEEDCEHDIEAANCFLLAREIEVELLKRYEHGVCCFSSVYDSPLLWSHYGDQQHGICIGYTTDGLTHERLEKVEYGGSRKILTSLIADALLNKKEDEGFTLDREVLCRKAGPGGYEEEWRMIGRKGLQSSSLRLTDVTFGLCCSRALKYVIYKGLEARQSLQFFEMREGQGTFELRRNPLDPEKLCANYQKDCHALGGIMKSLDL